MLMYRLPLLPEYAVFVAMFVSMHTLYIFRHGTLCRDLTKLMSIPALYLDHRQKRPEYLQYMVMSLQSSDYPTTFHK